MNSTPINITDAEKRVDSEAGLIASLIHNPDFIFHSEELLPSHFTDYENQCVYMAISKLVERDIKTVDPYNIIEVLSSSPVTEQFAKSLTPERLFELIEMSDSLARSSIEEYKMLAKNVLNAAFRRDLYRSLQSCLDICRRGDDDEIQRRVYQAIDSTVSSYSSTEDIPAYADVVDDLWEEIKVRQERGYSGIPFMFDELNKYATAERGELIIFAAQQKVGKSILLLNIAVEFLKLGLSVLYIDSELSSRLFTARLHAYLSGVKYRDVTSGQYTQEQGEELDRCREWIKTRNFTHVYMPFFDQKTIFSTVKRVNHRQPIDVIIIDYFKATGDEMDAYATYASMGRCVDMVKNEIAGDMNIIAIGAAQLTQHNRLADSSKIARNASTIILVSDKTPEEIEQDGPECGNKKMVVAVNRNGGQMAPGEYIDLQFDGDHISFRQAPQQHQHETPY